MLTGRGERLGVRVRGPKRDCAKSAPEVPPQRSISWLPLDSVPKTYLGYKRLDRFSFLPATPFTNADQVPFLCALALLVKPV